MFIGPALCKVQTTFVYNLGTNSGKRSRLLQHALATLDRPHAFLALHVTLSPRYTCVFVSRASPAL